MATPHTPTPAPEKRPDFTHEQQGYQTALTRRQMQMIAIGGAIGTGLFLGAGSRLADGGPLIVLVFAVCGFFAFIVLRALGELILHRPSSGSFVSYAREFYGEKLAFVSGWLYSLNGMLAVVIGPTAAAVYAKHWVLFAHVPQWLLASTAVALVLGLNLISVRVFGELEFWFSLLKVLTIGAFMVFGIIALVAGWNSDLGPTGTTMLAEHGGLLPHGVSTIVLAFLLVGGVVFAYANVEFLGTAAGEAQEPAKVIPRAINSVVLRIAIFYCGSVLIMALLLPATAYSGNESPFVTVVAHFGNPGTALIIAGVMNLVVLTADLSSLNANLYSTSRILHSLSHSGAAPSFVTRMSKRGVPYGGLVFTAAAGVAGVLLNLFVPAQAFEIALNTAAMGTVCGWATIILCQMRLRRWANNGKVERPTFRLFWAPVTSWATLAFLALVVVLTALNYPSGTYSMGALVIVVAPLLVAMWFWRRPKVRAIARQREGFTDSVTTLPAIVPDAAGSPRKAKAHPMPLAPTTSEGRTHDDER